MSTYEHAFDFFKKPLNEVAEMYGYGKDNIYILNGDEKSLQNEYPTTYSNIISCRHHSDKRTPLEYAQDIVASWLVEDHFLMILEKGGLLIDLDGADRNRVILPNSKTSTTSDFRISFNGNTRKCELMNDYTGFWVRTEKLHLRDQKYLKLEKEQAILLAISVSNNLFTLFDFSKAIPAKYIPSHYPYGGKPAYEIDILKKNLSISNGENIVAAIKSLIK